MRTKLFLACILLAAGVGALALTRPETRAADKVEKKGPALVHNVFFTLKDNSADAKKKFLASCKKYLSKHPGEVYFAVGPIASELKAPVNDTDFDIALTIVFKDKAAHDAYQPSKRHKDFIAEIKADLKKVRVFDSYVD